MKQTIIIASIIVVLFSIQTVYFINTAKKNKSQILDYYSKNEAKFRDSINAEIREAQTGMQELKDSLQALKIIRTEAEKKLNNELSKLKQNVSYLNYAVVSDSFLLKRLRARN